MKELKKQNPVTVLFGVLGQLLAGGQVTIRQATQETSNQGRVIGYEKEMDGACYVYLLPLAVKRELRAFFRATGERTWFDGHALRDALANENLIRQREDGRWTHQFRGPQGAKFHAWRFDAGEFMTRCEADFEG